MNRITTIVIGLSAGLFISAQASAQSREDLSYTYLEGGASIVNIDTGPFSETEFGFNVRGSLDTAGGLYLQGSWDRWSIDVGSFEIDTDLFKFGAGYRFELGTATDLFLEGSYAELDAGGGGDDGFRGDIGVRHGFSDNVEGRVFGGFLTDGSNADAIAGADVLFKFTENFGFSLGFETFEFDLNVFRANLRLSY